MPVTSDDTTERAPGWTLVPAAALLLLLVAAPLAWTVARGATSLGWVASSQLSTVVNSVLWVVGVTVGAVVVGTALALLLHRRRTQGLAAALLLVPAATTGAVVAVAWRALFAYRPSGRSQVGLVNEATGIAGIAPVAWLTQEPLVNTVVLVAALAWAAAGVVAVVLLARLDATTPDPDTTVRWADVRHRLLPQTGRPLLVIALVVAAVALRAHDIVRVATGGAFDTQVLSTEALDRALVESQPGRGAALGIVMLAAFVPLAALLVVAIGRSRHDPQRARGRHSRGRHSRPAQVSQLEHSDGDEAPTASADRQGPRPLGLAGLVLAVVLLVPLVGLVATALRPAEDVAATGWWHLVVDPAVTIDNVREVLRDGPNGGMWRAVVDTFALAVPSVLLTLGLAIVAGDGLRRLRPATSRAVRGVLVVAALVPAAAVLPALAEILDEVGLHGSPLAAWLAHVALGLPLTVLVLHGGRSAGRSSVAAERVVAAAAIQFVVIWADLLVTTSLVGGDDRPIPVAVRLAHLVAARGEELHLVAAAALVTAVVPVAVVLSMRRPLIRLVVADRGGQTPGATYTS